MKIEASQIQLNSGRRYERSHLVKEELQAWVGERPQNPQGAPQAPIRLDLSQEALDLLGIDTGATAVQDPEAVSEEEDGLSQEDKLKIRLLEHFLSVMTGKKVKLNVPSIKLQGQNGAAPEGYNRSGQAQGAPSAGWGMIYNRQESIREYEHTDFSAKGVVRTADGREIRLQVDMHMERAYAEDSTVSIRAGDALKDPLVLNFNGNAAGLSTDTFHFDLDQDGTADQISLLKSGSGFLALDRNENGQVDDGGELFGPATDSGFGELQTFDSDQNQWIDENDPIFNKLRIWLKDDSGNDKLVALGEMGVGAIYLGNVSTEFTLRQLDTLGKIRNTGLFLNENGTPGTVQELDLRI